MCARVQNFGAPKREERGRDVCRTAPLRLSVLVGFECDALQEEEQNDATLIEDDDTSSDAEAQAEPVQRDMEVFEFTVPGIICPTDFDDFKASTLAAQMRVGGEHLQQYPVKNIVAGFCRFAGDDQWLVQIGLGRIRRFVIFRTVNQALAEDGRVRRRIVFWA